MESKAQGPGNLLLYNNLLCAYSGNQRIMESNHENSGQVRFGGGREEKMTEAPSGKVVIPGEVTWRLQISLFCCHDLILHISIKISEHCQTSTLPLLHEVLLCHFFFSPLAAVLFWSVPVSQLFSCAMPPFSSSSLFVCSLRVCGFKYPSSIQLPVIFLILAHLAWIRGFKDPLDIQSNSFLSPGRFLNGRKEMPLKKSTMKNVMLFFLFLARDWSGYPDGHPETVFKCLPALPTMQKDPPESNQLFNVLLAGVGC